MCTRKFAAAALAAGGLLGGGNAPAAVVLEFDFQNVDGTNINASANVTGSSGAGHVSGSAVVDTGLNEGMDTGLQPSIRYGSLTVGNSFTDYVITSGSDGQWSDYSGVANFGTITAVMVFKPTNDGRPATRSYLWHSRQQPPAWNAPYLGTQRGNEGTADLQSFAAYYSGGWQTYTVTTLDETWDNDTWYFIATSWTPGQPMTSYIRPLGSSAYNFESGANLVASPYWYDGPITVGGQEGAAGASRSSEGTFALFQLMTGYTADAAAFDALYDNLYIPEPGTIGLLAVGGLMLRGMRRRVR